MLWSELPRQCGFDCIAAFGRDQWSAQLMVSAANVLLERAASRQQTSLPGSSHRSIVGGRGHLLVVEGERVVFDLGTVGLMTAPLSGDEPRAICVHLPARGQTVTARADRSPPLTQQSAKLLFGHRSSVSTMASSMSHLLPLMQHVVGGGAPPPSFDQLSATCGLSSSLAANGFCWREQCPALPGTCPRQHINFFPSSMSLPPIPVSSMSVMNPSESLMSSNVDWRQTLRSSIESRQHKMAKFDVDIERTSDHDSGNESGHSPATNSSHPSHSPSAMTTASASSSSDNDDTLTHSPSTVTNAFQPEQSLLDSLRTDLRPEGLAQIARFAHKVPGFSQLPPADQTLLINSTSVPIVLLRAAFAYGHNEVAVDGEPLVAGQSRAETLAIVRKLRASLCSDGVFNEEIAVLSAICIFRPDCPGLSDSAAVERAQETLLEALQMQVHMRGANHVTLPRMLMKLSELLAVTMRDEGQTAAPFPKLSFPSSNPGVAL
uniref:NR LBD domain-containing protein n=1 Tax=Plectus sambesii TaxID=2011161 RepID=A0A914W7V9_9BILA